jgi:putative SbcD/Mre11-related phosphoesterase
MTKPLTDELGVELVDDLLIDSTYLVHGHELPESIPRSVRTVVIGHVHPAINISDGVRNERLKCFLLGSYKQKRLLVLPSFSTIVEGSDILKVASNSPFLQGESSLVYVLSDEIRPFGKVKDLRRLLG